MHRNNSILSFRISSLAVSIYYFSFYFSVVDGHRYCFFFLTVVVVVVVVLVVVFQLELLTRKQLLNLRYFSVFIFEIRFFIRILSAFQTVDHFVDHVSQADKSWCTNPIANHHRKQQTCRYMEHFDRCGRFFFFIFRFFIVIFFI